MSIPLKLHQIWLGPHSMPIKWMDTWRKKNPNMEYSLWTSYQGFRYQDKIGYMMGRKKYAVAADIMRVEILYKEGGVYVDADSECLETIEDAPFMSRDFFVGRDFYQNRRSFQPNRVANGTIGSLPGHPILRDYMERIGGIDQSEYWRFGAQALTDCLEGKDVAIVPTCTFTPRDRYGRRAEVEGKIYAEQYWGTTTGAYK